jgi:uncharacterized membrane protein YbhN (UPF0104 family)
MTAMTRLDAPAGALREPLDNAATLTGALSPHTPLTQPRANTPVAGRRLGSPRAWGGALVLVGVVALAIFGLSRLDLAAAAAALQHADPQLLAAAVVLYVLAQTISGAMWAVCQESGGVRGMPLGTALGMHWIARGACELLPASLGEVVRVGLVRRHPAGHAAGTWRITGGVAGYKVVDAVVTAALVLAIAIIVPMPGPAEGLRWTAVGIAAVLAAVAVAWRLGAGRWITAVLPARARDAAARLGEGAGVLTDAGGSRTAAVLAAAAATTRLLSLGALLLALGAPPEAAGLAFCVIVLAGVVPAAPGGAGARELVLVPALALGYGMPASTALAFSVAVQAAALGTSLMLGAAALAWLGPRLTRPPAECPVVPEEADVLIPEPAASS